MFLPLPRLKKMNNLYILYYGSSNISQIFQPLISRKTLPASKLVPCDSKGRSIRFEKICCNNRFVDFKDGHRNPRSIWHRLIQTVGVSSHVLP